MAPSEQTLVDFFRGDCGPEELERAWRDAFQVDLGRDGQPIARRLYSTPPDASFNVQPEHCVALVDAVLAGTVSRETLDVVCFALEASDSFEWNTDEEGGNRVAESLFLLGTPEVNYTLSAPVLEKIRYYLTTGTQALGPADLIYGKRTDTPSPGVPDVWKRLSNRGHR